MMGETEDDVVGDSLEELKVRGSERPVSSTVDIDDYDAAEGMELLGADPSNEELTVRVLSTDQDEFTCVRCSLVHHRSQLSATDTNGQPICHDCG